MRPPTWAAGPRSADEAATGRKAAKAVRKNAHRVQGNVLAQCDRCRATDDPQHRIGIERHKGCGGTFRLFGHAEVSP